MAARGLAAGYRGGKWRASVGSEKRSALGKFAMRLSWKLERQDYGLACVSINVPTVAVIMRVINLEGSNQVVRKGEHRA